MSKPDSTDTDALARVLIAEINATSHAQIAMARQLETITKTLSHTEALVSALRQELSATRAQLHNRAAAERGESPIAKLVHTVTHKPPTPRPVIPPEAPNNSPKRRHFLMGREILAGQISHVVRARNDDGTLIELPCSYDCAHKFVSMPALNRRLHWHGHHAAYTALLGLAIKLGFAERRGRGWVWTQRFGLPERLEWVNQFRPPSRVR